jgi:uncharacterized protein (TIGR00661 family)
MKILYAIQGTGNGHLTRAMEIVPLLKTLGETDVLVSGIQADLKLPFKVDFRFKGLSFIFGKAGGINIWQTYLKMNSKQLFSDIRQLKVSKYDLVISDFEPVSAWACNLSGIPCIGLSNQMATLHPMAPQPKSVDFFGKWILQHYAPVSYRYGFHYKALDSNIFTPIIRKEVREKVSTQQKHYTVYLPSYDDERIINNLGKFKRINWQVFSKHSKKNYQLKNIQVYPLQSDTFLNSLATSKGVICNAGFGTTSEALFLGKKLLVVPMKTQYEQKCNAAMLKSMGVGVVKSIKKNNHEKIADWIEGAKPLLMDYPDQTLGILEKICHNHGHGGIKMEGLKESNFFK